LPDLTLILLSAGNSTRFSPFLKKQWLRVGDDPLWLFVAKRLNSYYNFSKTIITANRDDLNYKKRFLSGFEIVEGAKSRQESLKNALLNVQTEYVLVSDVARACVSKDMLEKIIKHKNRADIIVPYLNVNDTVVYKDSTICRDDVKLIQTPQLSKTKVLKKALNQKRLFTDDSSAIKSINGDVFFVKGDECAKKITYFTDLESIRCLNAPSNRVFIGSGFDVHPFEDNKPMYLGGVHIKSKFGFKAHSDGDVALHALIDALLGAIGCGDIGELFPDSDEAYKDLDSKLMLKKVVAFVKSVGFEINNVDITIIAQTPKISSYKKLMQTTIASILQIEPIFVNIKATTTEQLGFIGRNEGVAVKASTSLNYFNWRDYENIDSRK